jgi:hypothetical protein
MSAGEAAGQASIALALVMLACALGGGALGMWFGARLPANHIAAETMKMVIGAMSTLTALVLGLLVASAKGSFDAKVEGVAKVATDAILLDRTMAQYGPETSGARELLRAATAARAGQTRLGDRIAPAKAGGAEATQAIESLQRRLLDLRPATDAQRALQAKALAIGDELAQTRWLTLMRAGGSTIPNTFLVVLLSWTAAIFAGMGILAPRNATSVLALVVCAFSFSAALFLILDLDQPYGGLIGISDAPLRFALEHLGR